jgi:hypothetical protein
MPFANRRQDLATIPVFSATIAAFYATKELEMQQTA